MCLPHKLLARTVVVLMLLGMLPAFQPLAAEAQDTATYNLTKYDCAPGYDPGSGDASAAFSNCVTPSGGVSFTLSSGDGSFGSTQQTDGGGYTGWSGIPLGVGFSVSESIPNGYGVPWVYCEISGDPNNPGDVQRSFFQAPGGNMDVGYTDPSLVTYTQANCTWFNIVPNDGSTALQPQGGETENPTGQYVSVTIDKYVCAYDPNFQKGSFSDLITNCQTPQSSIPFTIGGDQSTVQSTNGSGNVQFINVAPGNVIVREEAYAGPDTVAVYCTINAEGQPLAKPTESDERIVTYNSDDTQSIAIDNVTAGQQIYCRWFDATVTESHLGSVLIYKYLCPDSHDPNADFDTTSSECSTPVPNPAFQLSLEGLTGDATGDANGFAWFLNYTPGTYTLKQTQPSGYYPLAVYCYNRAVSTGPAAKSIPDLYPLSSDGTIQLQVQAGYEIVCFWYDSATATTTTDTGSVYIYKYTCDPSFDWQNGSYDYLEPECTSPQEGVYFEVQNGSYTQGQTTDNNGEANWSDVPTGPLTIVEQTPSGYQIGRVFCAVVPTGTSNGSWNEVTYDEGIAITLDPGYEIYCVYFNIPSDYGTVHVYKYNCPEGFDWQNGGYDYLLSECSEPGDGVYFEVRSNSYQRGETTDADGAATWDDVPAGTNTLSEDVPDGYQVGRIFCGVTSDNSGSMPASWDEYSYAAGVEIDVPSGQYVHCYVFDVPTHHGTIYVYKYNCPSDHDWENTSYDYWLSGCTEAVQDVEFDVTQGSNSETKSTDSSGTAQWDVSQSGSISLEEVQPDGYVLTQVFCGAIETGGDPADVVYDPLGASQPTTFDLDDGYDLYCYFFNFPDDYGHVIVTKYVCYQLLLPLDSPGIDYATLDNQCTQPGEGFQFNLNPGGSSPDMTTDASGVAEWSQLEAGTQTLTETLPTGWGTIGAWCTSDPSNDASWEQYALKDELTFDLDIEEGATIYCSWYNWAPAYDSYVEVTKYICEEGDITTTNPDYMDYQSTCQDLGSGWKLGFTDGSGTRTATTGASGSVTFGSNDPGPATLLETTQPGYGTLALYCNDGSTADSWVEVPLLSTDTEASGSITLPSGASWTCQWFNYHYPDSTNYPITITKYNCEHFLVRGWPTRADYEAHCTEWAEGVEFRALAGMNVADSATTDASGVALLEVPAGSYQIVETPVDGYVTGAVYCSTSTTDDPAQEETLPLEIDVSSGYPVTCVWYNAEDVWDMSTADPGTIVVHKVNCPPGYPADGMVGFEDLLEGCTLPAENISFSVIQGGSQVDSDVTNALGELTLTGAAVGMATIGELPITGWDPPRVFCSSVPVGLGRKLVSYDEMTVTNWAVDYDIPADSFIDCYWFDRLPYAGTDTDPVRVIIHKVVCDEGIDEPGDSYAGASTECTTPEEGVEFTVTGGDGATASGPTDLNGYAEYNGLVAGSIKIAETPRDGYTTGAVFCSYTYGMTVTDPFAFPVEDEAIETYLGGGYTLECFWYNIVETKHSRVEVWKYLCPSDIDLSSYSKDYLEAECTDRPAGVEFVLSDPDLPYEESQSTDSGGNAVWTEAPTEATVDVSEVPNGYQPIVVYCGSSDGSSDPITWTEYPLTSDGSIEDLHISWDRYTACYWFNVEAHHDPQVWFYKYNCDEDASWHWDYHQLLSNCTEWAEGVEFGFGPEGSGQSAAITDSQGRWSSGDLDPGTWFWEEHYPSGYSGAVVYCQWVDPHGSGEYQKAELDGATLWLDLEYNQVVTCYWFDFPDGHAPASPTPHSGSGGSGSGGTGSKPPPLSSNIPTGPVGGTTTGGATQPSDPNAPATLIITKYTCDPGYDIYADQSYVEADCDELTEDVEFGLTDLTALAEADEDEDVLPAIEVTDTDGEATWSDLAAGPYLLVETMPEDTQEAFIWTCESDAREFQTQYPLTPFSYAGPDGQIGITLIPGETLECAWYNVPVAPGAIKVLKFECPSSPVIVAQCDPAGAGVVFSLAPAGVMGAIVQLTTDDSGAAAGEAPAGDYTLTEQDATPCLIDSEAIDANGNIAITAGETVEVRLYNCDGGS